MTDEQTADDIMAMRFTYTADGMRAAIVRALQQAREEGKRSTFDSTNPPDPKPLVWKNGTKCAPAGHIIDDRGVVRKVLGTLPVTADGCVCGDGSRLFSDCGLVFTHIVTCSSWPSPPIELDGWYSTSEAAEKAKEEKA